jgi:hypothetical protein
MKKGIARINVFKTVCATKSVAMYNQIKTLIINSRFFIVGVNVLRSNSFSFC